MKTSEVTSQMTGESVVVALTDDNNKPFREHDFKKGQTPGGPNSCKVYVPFNTEYKILVKNQNFCRIKIDAELDGTNITGDGLVISNNSSCYLERFVGGEGKKFLFVPVDSDAVGDPTSKENGILRIKIAKENKKPIDIHHHHWYPRDMWGGPYDNPLIGGYPYKSTYTSETQKSFNNILRGSKSCDYSAGGSGVSDGLVRSCSVGNVSYDVPVLPMSDVSAINVNGGAIGAAGATVEGGNSNQKFQTTTWDGDTGTIYTFVFKLLGVSSELSEQDKKDLAEFERLKEKFGKK